MVAAAASQIGVPYVWGGAARYSGLDCSGLSMTSWAQVGVDLPRTAQQQYTWGVNSGRGVSINNLRPGDLVFWGDGGGVYHVAVYAGGGEIIEAPYPGATVRRVGLYYGNLMALGVRPA